MNIKLYVENPVAARKLAFAETYESVQNFLAFYLETEGLKHYGKENNKEEILRIGSRYWQKVMDSINSNAIFHGEITYGKMLNYVNAIKELIFEDENRIYTTIKDWHEKYPNLLSTYQSLEEGGQKRFLDYFNELRIAANKEFLKMNY